MTGVNKQRSERSVTWGLGDVGLGLASLWILTVLIAPAIFAITGAEEGDVPLQTVALLQIPFDGAMLAVVLWASITKGNGPVVDFGLRAKLADLGGLLVGLLTQYAALLVYLPFFWFDVTSPDSVSEPARDLTDKANSAGGVILLVLIVVIAAPIVEELFFRGLVMRALERRYDTRWAVVGSSAIFAAAHLEPLQFPALFIFGLVAAMLTIRTGRLGPGMAAHVAFNAVAVITLLS